MKKNHEIKIRIDKETLELIQKSIQKLQADVCFKITQPDFLRSAVIDYCQNILANKIQIQIKRT